MSLFMPITRRPPSALGPGCHLHASVRALGPLHGAQRRPRVACRAGGVEEDGDDGGRPDIDALASYLSREAARLRDASSSAPGGGSSGSGGGGDAAEDRPLLVPHSDEIEGRLLEQVWGGISGRGRPAFTSWTSLWGRGPPWALTGQTDACTCDRMGPSGMGWLLLIPQSVCPLSTLPSPFLTQIGSGGFDTSEIELVQQLGSISMQQVLGPEGVV